MADLIKSLRTLHPEASISEILDMAREIMMKDYSDKIASCENILETMKPWTLTRQEMETLILGSKFTPMDIIWDLYTKEKKVNRRNWLSCLGSSST
jgi:predicted membrane chloride channel (bestrophin family)